MQGKKKISKGFLSTTFREGVGEEEEKSNMNKERVFASLGGGGGQ